MVALRSGCGRLQGRPAVEVEHSFNSVINLAPLRLRRVRAFEQRNANALIGLQRRGLADPQLDPHLAARALSTMVSRIAYLRYVQGYGNESAESLVQTLTKLWAGALGIGARPTAPYSEEMTER
jgi:hypothetical protein